MPNEELKTAEVETPKATCEYNPAIRCVPALKAKGCEFCLQVHTRDFLCAMHQNITLLVQNSAPKKIVNLKDMHGFIPK